jgi:methylglutaconyl-CoA hydratase
VSGGPLRVERHGDLVRVTLDDAARSNALGPAMIDGLAAAFRRDWRAEGVRALVLAGAGRNFCAGADLEQLAELAGAGELAHRLDARRLRDLFDAVLRQEALTVAAVHGACVAGGCGLATACDFVVAGEDARFMYSEVRIGFVAALVATFLPLRVRGADLRELLLDPEFVDARRALAIGLVNRVVPAGEHGSAAEALAVGILAKASSESVAATKRLLLAALGRPLDERLDLAAEVNAAARGTADCRRGVAHFLAHKKSPDWRT